MTTSKVLHCNNNEIRELIESTSSWSVSPLDRLDDLDTWSNTLLLFDMVYLKKGTHLPVEWTVSELLERRPEWEQQILPLLKSHRMMYLFAEEWCVLSY